MLNQLRSTYRSWNQQIFTKPKGAVRAPQKSTISYKQAAIIRDFADSYFSSQMIDANEIRLRKPPDEIAEIPAFIDYPFEGMKIAAENTTPSNQFLVQPSNNSPVPIQFRYLAYLMKSKEYRKLLKYIENIFRMCGSSTSIIIPVYGYIASICQHSNATELNFIQKIENLPIDSKDQKHFYHLFDELCSLPDMDEFPTLLHLFIGDVYEAITAISSTPHIFPILATNYSFVLNLKLNSRNSKIYDDILCTRTQASSHMPALISTLDENDDKNKGAKKDG